MANNKAHRLSVQTCERIDFSDEVTLRNALRSEHPIVIVLTGKEPFSKREGLVALLDAVDVSVLLLGDGRTTELE